MSRGTLRRETDSAPIGMASSRQFHRTGDEMRRLAPLTAAGGVATSPGGVASPRTSRPVMPHLAHNHNFGWRPVSRTSWHGLPEALFSPRARLRLPQASASLSQPRPASAHKPLGPHYYWPVVPYRACSRHRWHPPARLQTTDAFYGSGWSNPRALEIEHVISRAPHALLPTHGPRPTSPAARSKWPLGGVSARLLRAWRLWAAWQLAERGRLTERPATAYSARASRLQSRRFHRL